MANEITRLKVERNNAKTAMQHLSREVKKTLRNKRASQTSHSKISRKVISRRVLQMLSRDCRNVNAWLWLSIMMKS